MITYSSTSYILYTPQTPLFFKEIVTSLFNVLNAVSTGLKPHSSGALGKATWSIISTPCGKSRKRSLIVLQY